MVFYPGQRLLIKAGGCVQTGGKGLTWKRYVDPRGPDSDRLYHGLIGLPFLTSSFRQSPIVSGLVRIQDVVGRVYVVPALKAGSREPMYLRLGYEDDDYSDNGYRDPDNGTGDQCKDQGPAYVEISILN
jgi:hypothetical protein